MPDDDRRIQYNPVPEWTPRHSMGTWDADTNAGRHEVSIPQPPLKEGDDWTVTAKILKRPGEGPIIASLLIEPTWWALNRERSNDPAYPDWTYFPDDFDEVPPGGLTRSRVIKMSWEDWREEAHEWLTSLTPKELRDRNLDMGDVELVAPRKKGARHKMTDLTKAQTALKYVSAYLAGENTGAAVAEFLGVSEKRARNLTRDLRKEDFLTKAEGKKPGGSLTPKTKDILIANAKTHRRGKANG